MLSLVNMLRECPLRTTQTSQFQWKVNVAFLECNVTFQPIVFQQSCFQPFAFGEATFASLFILSNHCDTSDLEENVKILAIIGGSISPI